MWKKLKPAELLAGFFMPERYYVLYCIEPVVRRCLSGDMLNARPTR
jgi:hypothetical protein